MAFRHNENKGKNMPKPSFKAGRGMRIGGAATGFRPSAVDFPGRTGVCPLGVLVMEAPSLYAAANPERRRSARESRHVHEGASPSQQEKCPWK